MSTANVYNEDMKTTASNNPVDVDIDSLELSANEPVLHKNQDLHYLYQQAPIGIILNIIAALLVCWFILPFTPDYLYIPWLTFVVVTAFSHTLLIKEFNKNKNSLHVNNQWAIYHTFMVGITALAFSIGYLLFLPLADSFTQVILLLILATLSVSFLPVLSIFLPAYIIFISAFIFPTVFWIYSLPPEDGYPVTALLSVLYCMLIVVASYYSKALLEAFGMAGKINKKVESLVQVVDKTNTLNSKLKKDVFEFAQTHDSVSRQKEQAEITLQSIGEGVIATDEFGRINYINPVAEIYTGWNAKDIKGKHLSSILNILDETSHVKLADPIEQCLQSNTTIHGNENALLVRRDGLEYAIEFSTTPIKTKNNKLNGSVMVFRDVTEKRSMQKNLNWQAKHDALTGLINRREFDNRLNKILENINNSGREHALCFIDLDRFKLVNDTCGHQAGDELLIKIAERLRKITRDTDTLARLGGDEFAVIMYSCTLEKAKLIAEIFCEEVSKIKFNWNEKVFSVSASIGVVPITETTESLTELQRIADIACYKAKGIGGNRVEIFRPGTTEQRQYTGELKLLQELQNNLDKESFKIYTHKIKPLDDLNDTIFYEVLLRMENYDGKVLSASHFIHTAESYHLLSSIDNWVIKVVMEMIAYGNPLFNEAHIISMNLSQQSILNDKFITNLIDMFNDYDVPAGSICFELNEPKFYGSTDIFKRFVTLIKRQGCKVALDDFNYTPASINMMKQLGIDYIKLDARQFGNLDDEKDFNYRLLESINNINHIAGAQTIIKCIDNKNIIESLFEIGTDYVQGYAIEPPQALNNKKLGY